MGNCQPIVCFSITVVTLKSCNYKTHESSVQESLTRVSTLRHSKNAEGLHLVTQLNAGHALREGYKLPVRDLLHGITLSETQIRDIEDGSIIHRRSQLVVLVHKPSGRTRCKLDVESRGWWRGGSVQDEAVVFVIV